MTPKQQITKFQIDELTVRIFPDDQALGAAAAGDAAAITREAIRLRGGARVVVGTGNSQLRPIESLTQATDITWSAVEVFHLDEYVGIGAEHPASFRRWVVQYLVDKVRPGKVHYMAGDAPDLQAEMERYSKLLTEAPIDLSFVGFGENGHIAFNDPHVADFSDPLLVKIVRLDEACRRQQVGEGHFPDIESVPLDALTLTCPALMLAETWICCVPDMRKARAVKCALEGPVSTACPASLARVHPKSYLYLDTSSASLLSSQLADKAIENN
ncbi:MAG: 6-phosphogluconolactonase [Bryobacteraceae bacterium]